jgi:hypothetical protein
MQARAAQLELEDRQREQRELRLLTYADVC